MVRAAVCERFYGERNNQTKLRVKLLKRKKSTQRKVINGKDEPLYELRWMTSSWMTLTFTTVSGRHMRMRMRMRMRSRMDQGKQKTILISLFDVFRWTVVRGRGQPVSKKVYKPCK